jgi:TRAP-type mannitol/chloroaromatic compound transport system permease small subunit
MSNGTSSLHVGEHSTPTSGWLTFSGSLLIVVGFFHLVAGLVALFKPSVFVATQNQLVVFDYNQWGWTHILFSVLLFATAAALFTGKLWARIVTISLATLSAIANFGFMTAYPLWSILIIALDILVIYGVAMHGSEVNEYE